MARLGFVEGQPRQTPGGSRANGKPLYLNVTENTTKIASGSNACLLPRELRRTGTELLAGETKRPIFSSIRRAENSATFSLAGSTNAGIPLISFAGPHGMPFASAAPFRCCPPQRRQAGPVPDAAILAASRRGFSREPHPAGPPPGLHHAASTESGQDPVGSVPMDHMPAACSGAPRPLWHSAGRGAI